MDDQPLDLSRKSRFSVVEPYFSTESDPEPEKQEKYPTNRVKSPQEISKETGKKGGIVEKQNRAASFDDSTRNKESSCKYKLPSVSKRVSSNKTIFKNLDANILAGKKTPDSANSSNLTTRVGDTATSEDAVESCVMVKRQFSKEPATNLALKTNKPVASSSGEKNKNKSGVTKYVREGRSLHSAGDRKNLKTVKPTCVCTYCGKYCQNRSTLERHVRSHTGEKPFGCQQCEKKFAQKSALNKHVLQVHTAYHYFRCNECDKTFSQKSSLKRHSMIHSGERPFQCSICTMTFIRADHLNMHERTVHHLLTPYRCEICKREFRYKRQLNAHKCLKRESKED